MISNDYMKDSNLQAQIAELANSVGSGAKIQTGSYVGTGTYGASNPCSLTFDFPPTMVWIYAAINTYSYLPLPKYDGNLTWMTVLPVQQLRTTWTQYKYGFGTCTYENYGIRSDDGKTITWYHASLSDYMLNSNNTTYFWLALA